MQIKFFGDVAPLSDLEITLGKFVGQELQFVKAVAQGLMEVREGNTVSLEEAEKKLGIK